tara:strand:+ start:116 stop:283 length:168 start_codon:yes stop_codon:yes gene_type:complete
MSKTMEINKGTELMLRRKRPEPSPIKRLGTDTSFFFLKRKLRLIFELRWEKADNL